MMFLLNICKVIRLITIMYTSIFKWNDTRVLRNGTHINISALNVTIIRNIFWARVLWNIRDFITSCFNIIIVTRRVSLLEQELLTLSEHLSSPPVLSGVRVTQSLVLCVMFCRSLFVLCIVCPVLIIPLVFSNSSCNHLIISD